MAVARDTKTRFQGVFARHQESCRVSADGEPKSCNCTPSYYGVVWDRAARKQRRTRRFRGVTEARNARKDLVDALSRGTALDVAGPRLCHARDEFAAAARDGIALNKWGRRYRTTAWKDLDGSLRRVPDELARRRLGDVSRGDVQRLVDDMTRRGAAGARAPPPGHALPPLFPPAPGREHGGDHPPAH